MLTPPKKVIFTRGAKSHYNSEHDFRNGIIDVFHIDNAVFMYQNNHTIHRTPSYQADVKEKTENEAQILYCTVKYQTCTFRKINVQI